MKISKTSQKLAKQIFKTSLLEDKINTEVLTKFTKLLVKSQSNKNIEILSHLEYLVQKHLDKDNLVLESPFPISSDEKTGFLKHFKKLYNKELTVEERENKELISGIRVKLQDNVWENSVQSNLDNLKGTMNL